MKRIQFIEIEDQAWCPAAIRDGVTDLLRFTIRVAHLYKAVVTRLSNTLQILNATYVVDLCSGGGGPWPRILDSLPAEQRCGLTVCLTDLYPNTTALTELSRERPANIQYHPRPVSALDVPDELAGFRTLFAAFHHFDQDMAKAILQDAVDKNQGIAICESTQRHPLPIAYMFLVPLLTLLVTPFVRPFKWSRLVWTYLIPAIPLVTTFDGIVSCLRTYTPEELREMVEQLERADDYQWDIGIEPISFLPVGVTYLVGYPKQ